MWHTKESRVSCLSTSGCRLTNLAGVVFFLTRKVFFLPCVSSLPGMGVFLPWYDNFRNALDNLHNPFSRLERPRGDLSWGSFRGAGDADEPQGAITLLKGNYLGQHRGSINLEYRKDPKHKEKLSRYLYYFSCQVFSFLSALGTLSKHV